MSYGVRGMEKKLLFSNRYEKDMDLFDDFPDDIPELSDIDDAKVPTIDALQIKSSLWLILILFGINFSTRSILSIIFSF